MNKHQPILCRYLPIGGFKPFIDVTMKLAYGDNADVLANKQVAAVQALSGTGACRLMAEFQNRYLPNSKVLIPKPTWSNHHNIWRDAKVPAGEFRYYKPETRGLDYDGMLEDLKVCPTPLASLSRPKAAEILFLQLLFGRQRQGSCHTASND